MKVRYLIEALQFANPDADVMLAGDGEGNSFRPMDNNPFTAGWFDGEESIYDLEDAEADEDVAAMDQVVVLWPAW